MIDLPHQVLDDETRVVYLEIPSSLVVLFQVLIELYEGIGTVRTIDLRRSLVCVITTNSMLADLSRLLLSIEKELPLRIVPPTPELPDPIVSYQKERKKEGKQNA